MKQNIISWFLYLFYSSFLQETFRLQGLVDWREHPGGGLIPMHRCIYICIHLRAYERQSARGRERVCVWVCALFTCTDPFQDEAKQTKSNHHVHFVCFFSHSSLASRRWAHRLFGVFEEYSIHRVPFFLVLGSPSGFYYFSTSWFWLAVPLHWSMILIPVSG